jgi:hypothetical protein
MRAPKPARGWRPFDVGGWRFPRRRLRQVLTALCVLGMVTPGRAQSEAEYELPPIHYSTTAPSNQVSALQRRLGAGQMTLGGADAKETLRRCLAALAVPEDSQVLVFSKTSLQRKRISPQTPRAIYFSDDCYVGWVPGGLVEVAISDPRLGLAFYQFDPLDKTQPPRFERDADCLSCHAGPLTHQWPGLIVRSVFPDASGEPITRAGSFRIGHENPLSERWGGWYVTGRHGRERHMGNVIAHDRNGETELNRDAGANVTNLAGFFPTERYLCGDSDIVALMVLEHQGGMQNRLVEGALRARKWLYYENALQQERGETVSEEPTGTALRVIEDAAEQIVAHLLFDGELALRDGGVQGAAKFQAAFRQSRRTDTRGRSLKDFDLRTRLFTYRCSYMIYSQAFDHLPSPLKRRIYRRLQGILVGPSPPQRYGYLGAPERQAIREILLATKPDLASTWAAWAGR